MTLRTYCPCCRHVLSGCRCLVINEEKLRKAALEAERALVDALVEQARKKVQQ